MLDLDAITATDVDLLPADLERPGAGLGSPRLEMADDVARPSAADTVVVRVPTPVTPQLVPDLRALAAACAAATAHSSAATPRVVGDLTPARTTRASAALARTCPSVHAASSPEAEEMTKLLENTFRDLVVSAAQVRAPPDDRWAARSSGGRRQQPKCDLAMRACTPTVLSTTWETTKFAAAER